MQQIEINGTAHDFDGDPDMPLLWYLRDVLGLTGSKFGCGIGACGACTVHLDGEPVRSCVLPAGQATGKSVTTIEGLDRGARHPLQQSWIDENVPQCGYCQSGQIMTAAALLGRRPQPTDEDIDRALAGNLCRCGTYPRIRKAIHRAARAMASAATPSPGPGEIG